MKYQKAVYHFTSKSSNLYLTLHWVTPYASVYSHIATAAPGVMATVSGYLMIIEPQAKTTGVAV